MTDAAEIKYWLRAKDKPRLLAVLMRLLAGGDARISFEGELADCNLEMVPGVSGVETQVLRRMTLSPRQQFVVLPLRPDTIRPILERILRERRLLRSVIHVQIEKYGELQFGSYDGVYPACIAVGSAVPKPLLDDLVSKGVLRSVAPA